MARVPRRARAPTCRLIRRAGDRIERLLAAVNTEGHNAGRHAWATADHGEVPSECLALLYPPGPDGLTAIELASRINSDTSTVERQLEDLADLGYVELDEAEGTDAPRAALTAEGYDLLRNTEDVLLATSAPASVRESDPR